jgi:Kef-type K+ transport system membrane component KefB/mannitol/fructose-specific phosphotransferase system IIA component (Ntr-type)
MQSLAPGEIVVMLAGLAVMLGLARAAGELFNRFGQPAIVGEILAGIVLGPTVLGTFAPALFGWLFPSEGAVPIAYSAITTVAVVLLLLIAGLEIDLSILWRQGRAALTISPLGIVVPFAIGFAAAWLAPDFFGESPRGDRLTFALFFGVAMSISALPVIAKVLLDLNLFRTDVGMLVMAAAMFDDLVGWIVFSIVLGMMTAGEAAGGAADHGGLSIWATIGLTVGLAVFALTLGRWLVHRMLPWIQSRLSWPGGVLSFTLVLTFAGAAMTEAIGIHAVFGAFLAGIAVGDSAHLRAQTRMIIHQFVTYIFAPIFFVSIGLRADFVDSFDLALVLGVLAIGFLGKLAGCLLGGWLGKLSWRDSWAIAFGMNARGAMEIILGLLALEFGLIEDAMFVALVVLALVSSIVSGPVMRLFLKQTKEWKLEDLLLTPGSFLPHLKAATRAEAIRELAQPAAAAAGLDPATVAQAVAARERIMSTGIGSEVAVPHARFDALTKPVLVLGHSAAGVDFDAPDGAPARLVFLLLTPREDTAAQIQIMGQIARLFQDARVRATVYESSSIDVVRALVKAEAATANVH